MTTSRVGTVEYVSDRPTELMGSLMGRTNANTFVVSAAGVFIASELDLTLMEVGLCGLSMGVGMVIAGLILPWLVRRVGRRAATWGGIGGMCIGTLIIAVSHALPLILIGYGLAGGFATLPLSIASGALVDHHGKAGPSAVTHANAVAVFTGLVVSGLFALFSGWLGWRVALGLPIVGCALLAVISGRVWFAALEVHEARAARGRMPWRFYVAGAGLVFVVAVEFTFNLWGAVLLSERTGLPPVVAATALTALLVGVVVTRFVGAWLARRYPPNAVLVVSLVVSFAGWAMLWISTNPVVSYAGLIVAGLGIGLHWPLMLAHFMATAAGRTDRASGAACICAGIGLAGGPFALGMLAERFGIHGAFLVAPVLMALVVAAVLLSSLRPSPRAAA